MRTGQIQTQVLAEFINAADNAERRDLTWWLLSTAQRLLATAGGKDRWLSRLNVDGLRLADRSEIYSAALAVFHSLQRLSDWQRESQRVSFYDDDYQTSQFWKSEWETRNGNDIVARSQEWIRSIQPLGT